MIRIQKHLVHVMALALCFIVQQQRAMDKNPNQQITWPQSIRSRLSNLAQRSENSYADIRKSYAQNGMLVNSNNQQTKTSEKK